MAVLTALAIGAVAVGTYMSYKSQKKAAKAQIAQQNAARRQSARASIRQAQRLRSQAVAGAVGAGAASGSGAAGGIGAIGSNLGQALGYASQQSQLSNIITDANQKAGMWSAVAQLGQIGLPYAMAADGKGGGGGQGFTPSPGVA